MKNLKSNIILLNQAANVLRQMVAETEAVLGADELHITDRLGITVNELDGIVKCLDENGVLDEELLDGAAPLVREFKEVVFKKHPDGIPMYFTAPR